MIAALSVAGGILSTILVFVLGVWSVKNTNKATASTDQLTAQTSNNTENTARLRIESESYERARVMDREAVEGMRLELRRLAELVASLRIDAVSYERARTMDHEVVAAMREELDRVRELVGSLRAELDETKTALHVSERNTARAERNVLTLRDLLIARGIPVPDLEGGNG